MAARFRFRRVPVCSIAVFLVTTAIHFPSPGFAGEETPRAPMALDYASPSPCTSRSVVVSQLGARGVRIADDAPGGRLSIAIRPSSSSENGAALRGELVVETEDGRRASRVVFGQDCGAIVSSLVLVAALAINPPALPPVPGASPVGPPESVSPGAPRPRPLWLAGARARGLTALATDPALGGEVFAERIGRVAGSAGSVTLSAGALGSPTVTVSPGSATFWALLARLEGCWPHGLVETEWFFVSPCAGLDAGVVQASGRIAFPDQATRPWVAPLLAARLEAPLARPLWVSMGTSAVFPLVRDTFVFKNPNQFIYRAPPVGGSFDIGLAAAFW
jgi:hypothetical protein